MLDVADALYSRFLPGSRESNRRKRSGHGDAPRALALARALLCTCRGDWPAAAQELDKAGRDRPVHLDSFERSLYGEVVRRVQAEGHAIADEIAPLTAEPHPAWLERILP
jgi:hypothetical protein